MSKFKAGDKVKVIASGWGIHPNELGKITYVVSTPEDWGRVEVSSGGFSSAHEGDSTVFTDECSLQLVEAVQDKTSIKRCVKYSIERDGESMNISLIGDLTTDQAGRIMSIIHE